MRDNLGGDPQNFVCNSCFMRIVTSTKLHQPGSTNSSSQFQTMGGFAGSSKGSEDTQLTDNQIDEPVGVQSSSSILRREMAARRQVFGT